MTMTMVCQWGRIIHRLRRSHPKCRERVRGRHIEREEFVVMPKRFIPDDRTGSILRRAS
jgi:hypothetical protein